jgi:hypothetical protein
MEKYGYTTLQDSWALAKLGDPLSTREEGPTEALCEEDQRCYQDDLLLTRLTRSRYLKIPRNDVILKEVVTPDAIMMISKSAAAWPGVPLSKDPVGSLKFLAVSIVSLEWPRCRCLCFRLQNSVVFSLCYFGNPPLAGVRSFLI